MLRTLLASAAALALSLPVAAQTKVEAVLAGHAAVPALSSVPAPADAGPLFATAGKFTAANRQRVEQVGAVATTTFVADRSAPRSSGVGLPVEGQAVQGFSGIVSLGEGRFLALTDNGFGSKANSVDALLMVHRVRADWASGRADREETIFLRDPDKKVPFAISQENTAQRYLTGADFDLESIQLIGDEMWIGDEFGPYLLRFDRAGKLLAVHETKLGDKVLKAPHHYTLDLPSVPGPAAFDVRRSRGFEPMAKSVDGGKLYPMFEGPIWDEQAKAFETVDGKAAVRILEFDVKAGAYTGRFWRYALENAANVVGDFQMVDATSGLIIERDDASEGTRAAACTGAPALDCFNKPAAFKRVYKIDFGQADAGGLVRKVAYIDLTDIADPNGAARIGAKGPRFEMPHLGPEGLAMVDSSKIVVVNDNNLPYSSGRTIGKADDNELALIDISALLAAR